MTRIHAIDRRFYRGTYDAEEILGEFATIARDEISLKVLTDALIEAVQESLHPEHVSVWLRETSKY